MLFNYLETFVGYFPEETETLTAISRIFTELKLNIFIDLSSILFVKSYADSGGSRISPRWGRQPSRGAPKTA